MSAEKQCRDCHYWPNEKWTNGEWKMCRKHFYLTPKDSSCEDWKGRGEDE